MRYRVLTAFFLRRAQARGAHARLVQHGVPSDAIRVLPKEVNHLDDIGVRVTSKASEGAALGAVLGGLVGALAGALAASGALIIPGAGTVLAGAVVAALAFAGAGGCVGTLLGAVIGACLPEYEAAYLDDAVQRGGALLAVRCLEDRVRSVQEILVTSGARRVRRGTARRIAAALSSVGGG